MVLDQTTSTFFEINSSLVLEKKTASDFDNLVFGEPLPFIKILFLTSIVKLLIS